MRVSLFLNQPHSGDSPSTKQLKELNSLRIGVGEVVKLGPGADKANIKIGQRVGIKWISGICYSCPGCLSGREGLCFNQKVSGYDVPGTFQQYVCSPADYVTPIPDGLDSAEAAPM